MEGLPHQRTELHDGDEAAKVLHFLSLVLAVNHPRQVEQLGPLSSSAWKRLNSTLVSAQPRTHQCSRFYLIDLGPESMLEGFLGLPQGFVVLKRIEVRQNTHYPGKAVDLANVEELKSFHLKAKAGINQHENLVGNATFSSVILLEKTLLKRTGIAKYITY